MALNTSINVNILGTLTKTTDLASGGSTIEAKIAGALAVTLTSGTTAGKADYMFSDTRTISSGGTEDLDLSGALTDALKDTVVFVKVKLLWLRAAPANTVNLTVFGDAASVGFLGTLATTTVMTPGAAILLYNPTGYTVTAATGDILQVAAGAADSSYDVIVIGTSA